MVSLSQGMKPPALPLSAHSVPQSILRLICYLCASANNPLQVRHRSAFIIVFWTTEVLGSHLGGAAVAQRLLREAAAALDVLLSLQQRGQLGLQDLRSGKWKPFSQQAAWLVKAADTESKHVAEKKKEKGWRTPPTFCLVQQMFSISVTRAVLRWCSARSSSSNVLVISATASIFLSLSCREISVTSSMAAVSWGSLQGRDSLLQPLPQKYKAQKQQSAMECSYNGVQLQWKYNYYTTEFLYDTNIFFHLCSYFI